MAALDPRIEVIRERYGLDKSDFWELPQKKGTWVAKHSALEVAAVKAGIVFDNPVIIEAGSANGVAVISVRGALPPEPTKSHGHSEWSIGEASPKNNKNAYPWAMAEKRAKDRVILKLIGIHGLVYSEDELSGPETQEPFAVPASKADSREAFTNLMSQLRTAGNKGRAELRAYWTSEDFIAAYEMMPNDWREQLTAEKNAFLASYPKPTGKADPAASLDRQFTETMRQDA